MENKRRDIDVPIPDMIENRINNLEKQLEAVTLEFNQVKESIDLTTSSNTHQINILLELIEDFENREKVILEFENNMKSEKIKLFKELLYNILIGTTPLFIVPILMLFLFIISPEIVAMMPYTEIVAGSGFIITLALSTRSIKTYRNNTQAQKKIKYNNLLGNVQASLKSYKNRLNELCKLNQTNQLALAKEKEQFNGFKTVVEEYKEKMQPILESHTKNTAEEEEIVKLERKI